MNARSRAEQRILRHRHAATRAARRARKAVATGTHQSASTHLIAAGLTPTDAHRYSGAFSCTVTPTAHTEATVKLRGRRRKTVPLKLYDLPTFTARLATYRPRDKAAAARFERIAHTLAA